MASGPRASSQTIAFSLASAATTGLDMAGDAELALEFSDASTPFLVVKIALADAPNPDADINLANAKLLGRGAFGAVYQAAFARHTVAVKVMQFSATRDFVPEIVHRFAVETGYIARISHPNCVRFLAASLDVSALAFVTEFCPNGDLSHLIHVDGFFSRDHVMSILTDVVRGMAYLHAKDIVHRDLKPDNVLLDANFRAKVADFGLATVGLADQAGAASPGASGPGSVGSSSGTSESLRTTGTTGTAANPSVICGTRAYMAPEAWLGEANSFPADVWSFGTLVWETLTATKPPSKRPDVYAPPGSLALSDSRAPTVLRSALYPDLLIDALCRMFERSPAARPSFLQMLDVFDLVSRVVELEGAIDAGNIKAVWDACVGCNAFTASHWKMSAYASHYVAARGRHTGSTALHAAAATESTALLKELLAHGASTRTLDDRLHSPLDVAATPEVRAMLLEAHPAGLRGALYLSKATTPSSSCASVAVHRRAGKWLKRYAVLSGSTLRLWASEEEAMSGSVPARNVIRLHATTSVSRPSESAATTRPRRHSRVVPPSSEDLASGSGSDDEAAAAVAECRLSMFTLAGVDVDGVAMSRDLMAIGEDEGRHWRDAIESQAALIRNQTARAHEPRGHSGGGGGGGNGGGGELSDGAAFRLTVGSRSVSGSEDSGSRHGAGAAEEDGAERQRSISDTESSYSVSEAFPSGDDDRTMAPPSPMPQPVAAAAAATATPFFGGGGGGGVGGVGGGLADPADLAAAPVSLDGLLNADGSSAAASQIELLVRPPHSNTHTNTNTDSSAQTRSTSAASTTSQRSGRVVFKIPSQTLYLMRAERLTVSDTAMPSSAPTVLSPSFPAEFLATPVVAKALPMRRATADATQRTLDLLTRIAAVAHPNLVSHFGVCMQPEAERLLLVAERLSDANMFVAMRSTTLERRPRVSISYLYEVALGLEYLHRTGIPHGALKPENILFDQNGVPRLTNYGMRSLMELQSQSAALAGVCPLYGPPESVLGGTAPAALAGDIWSFGTLLWASLFCTRGLVVRPYYSAARTADAPAAHPGIFDTDVPAEIAALSRRCWAPRPEDRPTAAAVLAELADFRHRVNSMVFAGDLGGPLPETLDVSAVLASPEMRTRIAGLFRLTERLRLALNDVDATVATLGELAQTDASLWPFCPREGGRRLIDSLLAAIRNHVEDPRLVLAVLAVLAPLAGLDDGKVYLEHAKVFTYAKNQFARFAGNGPVLLAWMNVLVALSTNDRNKITIREEGALAAVLTAIPRAEADGHEELILRAVFLLGNISTDVENKAMLHASGLLPLLHRLLSSRLASEPASSDSGRCIGNVALYQPFALEAMASGLPAMLVSVVSGQAVASRTAICVSWGLKGMAFNGHARAESVPVDILPSIAGLVDRPRGSMIYYFNVAGFIQGLSFAPSWRAALATPDGQALLDNVLAGAEAQGGDMLVRTRAVIAATRRNLVRESDDAYEAPTKF